MVPYLVEIWVDRYPGFRLDRWFTRIVSHVMVVDQLEGSIFGVKL